MKKLFIMLILLFIFYLGIQFMFSYFSKGNDNEYVINTEDMEFIVKETSNFKDKNNNYYFEITEDNVSFKFQINNDFNKLSNVIKKIKYFKNDKYECILPIFNDNQVLVDVMCYDNDKINYYYNLKGKNKQLDEFVSKIEEYNSQQFIDSSETSKIEGLDVYKNNLIDNHYIGITDYKGIYDISKNFNSLVYKISLFQNDIYNQQLGIFTDKYYFVADYDKQYEFNKLNVVNLTEPDIYTITSDSAISFDGYIQGAVDNKIYLFDKDKQIQYEINIDKKTIVQYSKDNIKYYENGTWKTMELKDANQGKKFIYGENDYENKQYARIDKIGTETGYYYLYKKNNNKYDVYRMNIQDKENIQYIFSTKTIDNIYYIDDYVYFINGSLIQVHNDKFGVKNLIKYQELEFNKNINFSIYSK